MCHTCRFYSATSREGSRQTRQILEAEDVVDAIRDAQRDGEVIDLTDLSGPYQTREWNERADR